MNDNLKKILEEASNKEYSIEDTQNRLKSLIEYKKNDPENSKVYDILIKMNQDLIKYKNEIQ